jgi:hypothetical protein
MVVKTWLFSFAIKPSILSKKKTYLSSKEIGLLNMVWFAIEPILLMPTQAMRLLTL